MLDKGILREVEQIFQEEPRLITLPSSGYGVFVGDTHGDLNATETVLERYLNPKENTLIFLGDYVDRGEKSRENIDLLLETKVRNKDRIYLLMGNHEGYKFGTFSPADFWESLKPEERTAYAMLLAKLPFAASSENGLLGVHGVPPDVGNIGEINSISPGTETWSKMVWGDFLKTDKDYMGENPLNGRSEFGRKYFERVMDSLGKNVLVRSHQPKAAGIMYDNRCLTIFTSHAYLPKRTVAIADLGKETVSVDGLEMRVI